MTAKLSYNDIVQLTKKVNKESVFGRGPAETLALNNVFLQDSNYIYT